MSPPRALLVPSDPPRHGRAARPQRQTSLPWSKAVEIAYKSIRLRLGRSAIVTGGIVLALAFLMSILATDAMTDGMRRWATGVGKSAEFQSLVERRAKLEAQLAPLEGDLRAAARRGGAAPPGAVKFDAGVEFGKDPAALQKELGTLPVPPGELEAALALDPGLVSKFRLWVQYRREIEAVRRQYGAPQELESRMQAKGVPTTPAEIRGNRVQTRWLLALALLVAFVGILNAMLMSVTERFREIGTMKCLGALDNFIVRLFLLESLFQGAVGTVLGVLIGLALSVLASWFTYGEFAWKNFPARTIALSAAACLAVGVGLTVAAAVYPAWQAARMQPIEAMRSET